MSEVIIMSTFVQYVADAGRGIAGEAIVSDLYRERAAECMKLSVISCDNAIREGYCKLAEAYLKLANGAEAMQEPPNLSIKAHYCAPLL
jgi:hypothetical protein